MTLSPAVVGSDPPIELDGAPRDLFDALRRAPDEAVRTRLRGATERRWRELTELAIRTHTASLLHVRLRTAGIRPPTAVGERLARVYAWNSTRNTVLLAERDHACRVLAAARVPVMVLKSAHLAPILYPGVGTRSMSDVDLLVNRADAQRAQDALLADGYGPRERPPIEETLRRHRHLPVFKRPGHLPIELHWTLSEGRGATTGPEHLGVWDRAVPVPGLPAVGMEPLDAFVFTCRHLAVHHGFVNTNGLSGLTDLAEMLDRAATLGLEPAGILRRTKEWRIENGVWLCLLLARDLLGAPVDATLMSELRPASIDPEHVRTALGALLQPNPLRRLLFRAEPTLVPPPSASGALGKARWLGLARYLRAAAFPPSADLALDRGRLPAPVAWPAHWAKLVWTHSGMLRWPLALEELEAERGRRRRLLAFVGGRPSRS